MDTHPIRDGFRKDELGSLFELLTQKSCIITLQNNVFNEWLSMIQAFFVKRTKKSKKRTKLVLSGSLSSKVGRKDGAK